MRMQKINFSTLNLKLKKQWWNNRGENSKKKPRDIFVRANKVFFCFCTKNGPNNSKFYMYKVTQ